MSVMDSKNTLWKLILFLSSQFGTVTSICSFLSAESCIGYDVIQDPQFRAFIPHDSFEETCRQLTIPLDCVLQSKYTDGCSGEDTFSFQMQKNVVDIVCKGGNYMSHSTCLNNEDLKIEINHCTQAAYDYNDCSEQTTAMRECIKQAIEAKDFCSQSDVAYTDMLLYNYLKPYAATKQHCSLDEPLAVTTNPTTTPVPTTTTTSTTTATRKPDQGEIGRVIGVSPSRNTMMSGSTGSALNPQASSSSSRKSTSRTSTKRPSSSTTPRNSATQVNKYVFILDLMISLFSIIIASRLL